MDRYGTAEEFFEEFRDVGRGPQLAMKLGIRGEGSQVLSRELVDLSWRITMLNKDDRSDPERMYKRYNEILLNLSYILTHYLYPEISFKYPVHRWIWL
jgi:hypothetical protein